MNENIKLSFKLLEEKSFSYLNEDGEKTLSFAVEDKKIICYVYYDFRATPLMLSSEIEADDNIEIIFMTHRIELWVNSQLADEEWPAGKRLFSISDTLDLPIDIHIEEYIPTKTSVPCVIGEFQNAQGWRPDKNVFVGDCMPYVSDGRYHVLYLKDRHHHKSKWGLGSHQWEHISTDDFLIWQIHPTAIEITDPMEGSICTGSWIKKDNTEYLFYTVRMADETSAPIKRCIAKDGYHFEKDESFSLFLSEKYHAPSARDPKLVLDKNGQYHMFLTTSQTNGNGCLAHLISTDLTEWTECENPIYVHEDGNQPECPDYIEYNGYYYLIFSIKGKAHYMYSKEPFGAWETPQNPIIPCSSVPKGAVWNNKIIFTGFEGENGQYAGKMVFKSAVNDKNGLLVFE